MIKQRARLVVGLLVLTVAGSLVPQTVEALPPRDPSSPARSLRPPFVPPTNGFDWAMRERFGPKDSYGLVDFHWSDLDTKYKDDYLHPTSYVVDFDGCPTSSELAASETPGGQTQNAYTWEQVDANGTVIAALGGPARTCLFTHGFPALGTYRVRLVFQPSSGPAQTYTQDVTLTDILIVAIGDSYGSGEGNPDVPQVVEYDLLGVPHVKSGPVWQDKRCHRSADAPSSRAAMAIENADPHSAVTYLSFACSGATIATRTAPKENPLNPYDSLGWEGQPGTGILGPYRGVEPPVVGFQPDMLPSQIDQILSAVGNRKIDALLVSGGGNDMGFARVATVCVLVHQCMGWQVQNRNVSGRERLDERLAEDIAALPGIYEQLASRLNDLEQSGQLDVGQLFINEYPDPSRDGAGNYCGTILNDVIPLLTPAGVLAIVFGLPTALFTGISGPFGLSNDPILGEEVKWASETVAPRLNQAIHDAAARHANDAVPWRSVGGISDDFKNGHGYCANDRWIRTATEAALMQGPPAGPAFWTNHETKGTLHLNSAGNAAVARRIVDQLQPYLKAQGLLSPPPPTRQAAPSFDTSTQATLGANGWSVTSVSMQVTAVDDDGIQAGELAVNGVVGCPPPAIPNMSCEQGHREIVVGGTEKIDPKTFDWHLEFGASGVFQLVFRAEDFGGQISTLSKDVRIDLDNPTATASPPPVPPSGWYKHPVQVALDGADPTSGVQGMEYSVDGSAFATTAPGATVTVSGDGTHRLAYRALDWAGRRSTDQTLTVKIDTTPPSVTCGTADGVWHPGDVSIACTASDALSGLASESSFSLSTSVAEGTETANAATVTRTVCDVAGNCLTAGPVEGNKVDRKAPTIAINSPAAQSYVYGQTLTASYACADGGSGVGMCTGTLANGAAIDTSTLGTFRFAVNAGDAVGNASSAAVDYVVDRALTATAVSSSTNPSVFGSAVSFTASVTVVAPGAGNPTGSVQFAVDGHDLGAPVPLVGGQATSPPIAALQVGGHSVTATYSGDSYFKPSSGSSAQVVQCTVNRASVTGNLVVPSGTATCITGPNVSGSIQVQPGGALHLTNTTVNGSVSASGATAVTICGSRLNGALTISGTSGFVLLGGCAPNTFKSSLKLDDNRGGFRVSGNTVAAFIATNNAVATEALDPIGAPAGHVVKGNSISGLFNCTGNSPAPTNEGTPNSAKNRRGQCSGPGF